MVVRAVSFAPFAARHALFAFGAIAQLGERVLCKHEVVGSIPSGSTSLPAPAGWLGCGVLLVQVKEFAARAVGLPAGCRDI
jgi:hypothetical protein